MFKVNFIEVSNMVGIARQMPVLHLAACNQALTTYRSNILRHSALVGLPGYASLTSMAWATSSVQAQHEIFGIREVSQAEVEANLPKLHHRLTELMDQKMQGTEDQKRELMTKLTLQFQDFAGRSGQVYQDVLETVLKSILVLAWGTFEALTEDLLTGVIEETPSLFATVNTGKLRFTRRNQFREAYEKSFAADLAIMTAVNNQTIDALSLIRNLLVHKSGLVDERFQKESVSIPQLAPFNSLAVGEAIRIDGKTVAALVDPTLESGYALIESVDAWLMNHRTKL